MIPATKKMYIKHVIWKKLLKEREDETSFNQYRLKQDIEADQWINRKIMFFRIVVIALIILLVFFLFRLKNSK